MADFCWLCGWWCPTQLVAVCSCVLEGSCVVSVRNQGTIGRPNPQWAGHFPNFNRIWGNRPCRVPWPSKHIMFFREPRQKNRQNLANPPNLPEGPTSKSHNKPQKSHNKPGPCKMGLTFTPRQHPAFSPLPTYQPPAPSLVSSCDHGGSLSLSGQQRQLPQKKRRSAKSRVG